MRNKPLILLSITALLLALTNPTLDDFTGYLNFKDTYQKLDKQGRKSYCLFFSIYTAKYNYSKFHKSDTMIESGTPDTTWVMPSYTEEEHTTIRYIGILKNFIKLDSITTRRPSPKWYNPNAPMHYSL
jgi:hypothetical protein